MSVVYSFCIFICSSLTLSASADNSIVLPSLGDASSGTISLKKEHMIGQIFLQQLYRETKVLNDPLIQNYLENLVYKLAVVSELRDKRLTIVVINNPTLNAFAAPGGIIGVNTGLLLYANNEQELAAVLAHELAHLSQRHFSRELQDEKNNRLTTMAALLGGILLTAAGGGNAGIAAITSTMAGAMSHRLSFSRQQEAEADRIGIKTLYRAGMNPYAMPEMFQRLQQLQGGGGQQLAFLQTHPVTLSRIADTTGRAAQYPKRSYKADSLDFELMKMRIRLYYADNPLDMIATLQTDLKDQKVTNPDVARYGLALAFYKNKNYSKAMTQLQLLLMKNPANLTYQVLNERILFASGNEQKVLQQMARLVSDNSGYLPLTMLYAQLLNHTGNYNKCRFVLRSLIEDQPGNPFAWKLLADTTGKAGNISEYYMENANYLHLTGQTEKAIEQLQYALNSLRMTYEQRKAMQQQLIRFKKDKKFADNLSL